MCMQKSAQRPTNSRANVLQTGIEMKKMLDQQKGKLESGRSDTLAGSTAKIKSQEVHL